MSGAEAEPIVGWGGRLLSLRGAGALFHSTSSYFSLTFSISEPLDEAVPCSKGGAELN